MSNRHATRYVPDEDRRELLKALGVVGSVAVGGATIDELHDAVSSAATQELAPVGQAIRSDMGGAIDNSLIDEHQPRVAQATQALVGFDERGLPTDGQRDEFIGLHDAGRPIHDHLTDVGFYESTTSHLPEFSEARLQTIFSTFVHSGALSGMLEQYDAEAMGVDILAEAFTNAEELSTHHWVATDELPRADLEIGENIPPMTQGAAAGVLLWAEDLDNYLWRQQAILTDEILADAVWHGRTMGVGYGLMAEGARLIGAADGTLSDAELGALLSTAFAIQAISQGLLVQDVYWVTDNMRDSARPDIEVITK